jgi:hypothetical protein
MAEHHRLARLGKKHTDESKKKISRAMKGKTHSEETRRIMSEKKKAYWAQIRAEKQENSENESEIKNLGTLTA